MNGSSGQAAAPTTEDAIVLATFVAVHLGDTVCTSTLPRLLRQKLGRPVYVQDHPATRAVFTGNPHVSGFAEGPTILLSHRMVGSGHVIQRLEQGLELPVEPIPQPEIYLTAEEVEWAAEERRRWPNDRPACVLSTSACTDRGNLERVDWETVVKVLSRDFTVIQPLLDEPPVPGAIVYAHLPVRRYMALIAASGYFVGGTTGGAHIAAAFGVPSLIVAWRALLDHLRFPVSGLGLTAAFCYPQHWYIAAEDLCRGVFRTESLACQLREMIRRGRAQRPSGIGNYPRRPCGFIPAMPRPVVRIGNRLMRLPAMPEGQTALK